LIYQVQFKVKYRTDYFYVLQNEQFSLNDMVIVEADRGYDIGKIIALVETKEQKKKSKLNGDHTIKRIFRLANQDELLTYELKSKDEEMALFICQAKINQKNLNMEVVEAEYQW
jgi:cell fate regulator YaaT (PSP1 superfamily)